MRRFGFSASGLNFALASRVRLCGGTSVPMPSFRVAAN
ncbi:hypothetical protein GLE_3762 [Lysobacter enzymogenes]|uniref:Uncharacterized protein n=1 Tax=Lysobacter enzymogenes TaxID=69 RepID=A0A0S2DKS0_LYSEN|nr:hypothetical protein GLE_3762 [Lysobacter enzymogenes]